MKKPEVLLIYNPKAGINSMINEASVRKFFEAKGLSLTILHTMYQGHATQIANEAASCEKYELIVAAGGDGTVNEVANGIINSKQKMGIIPLGSGNGLARELGIPMKMSKSIPLLVKLRSRKIDAFVLNKESVGFNIAGVGFDAEIAHRFGKVKKRGLWSYVRLTLNSIFRFKYITLSYKRDNKTHQKKVFVFCIANSRQFGNNAFIAPTAQLDDGQMSIAIIRPFPWWYTPRLAWRLFAGDIYKSPYYECFNTSKLKVEVLNSENWHIDGEPVKMKGKVSIKVVPEALDVVVDYS